MTITRYIYSKNIYTLVIEGTLWNVPKLKKQMFLIKICDIILLEKTENSIIGNEITWLILHVNAKCTLKWLMSELNTGRKFI